MTSVESSEQYIIKDDSSGISKVEPRVYSSLHISLEFFIEEEYYGKFNNGKISKLL